MQLSFQSELKQDKDGTWWFVHVPRTIREAYKTFERRGSIRVVAAIGNTTWEGSLLPWSDGSAQLNVNRTIRSREGLELGQTLTITVRPKADT